MVVAVIFELVIALRFRDLPWELILIRLSTKLFHMKFCFSTSPRPVYRHQQNIHKECPNYFLLLCLLDAQLFWSWYYFSAIKETSTSTGWNILAHDQQQTHLSLLQLRFYLQHLVVLFYTQDILQSLASIFLVHMITMNIRSESVIFCLFVNHCFIHFGLHCLSL